LFSNFFANFQISQSDHCNFGHPKEYEAVAKSHAVKAYIRFCLDEEDSFEDEIDDYVAAKLAVLKSS